MALLALVQIVFDTGTEYFSFHGVGAPGAWYEPYVESISTIERESSVHGECYRISDLQINFINYNQYFSHKKGGSAPSRYFYNRTIKVLYGDEANGVAAMTTIFSGRIQKWNVTDEGLFSIRAKDFSYDRFRVPVTSTMKVLDTTTFPNLPVGTEPRLVPVVYGTCNVDSAANLATYDLGGPVPCYLIDTNVAGKWRYVVAQHRIKSGGILNAFIYGIKTAAANYTATEATYGGVTMTVIDFNADPRNSARSSELEVTAAVSGITDDGTPTGTLLTHPADILKDYLTRWTGTTTAEIDTTTFSDAKTITSSYACGFPVIDRNLAHSSIIDQWSESFSGSFYVTGAAKFAIYIKTSASLVAATTTYTHDIEIVENTFRVESNDNVAAVLNYNWLRNWPRGEFYGKHDQITISDQSVTLNASIAEEINMPHVRDSTTAVAVANSYADLFKEDAEFVTFEVTPDNATSLDLNNKLAITHWQGIGTAGYSTVTTRIHGLDIALTPSDVRVGVRALKLHQPSNRMIRPVLSYKMIRPVLHTKQVRPIFFDETP